MRLSTMVLGILLVGAMMVGFYTFVGDLASSSTGYAVSYTDYSSTFDNLNSTTTELNQSYAQVQESWRTDSALNYLILPFYGVQLAIDVIELPFNMLFGIVADFSEILGLPDWVEPIIFAVIIAFVVFALIGLALRYKYA